MQLKKTAFKESLMKECADVFFNPRFEELLDTRMSLLGFDNGVLDLETMEFREGRPEDYISLTTGINYRDVAPTDPLLAEVNDFLAKIFTKEDIRDYVLKVLSSCLDGFNREEKFYIWTGVGANGKSKMIELMMRTFGEYYSIMNVTAITGKRVSSNATNSELVMTKGKRMVVMQEPSEDEKINIGYLKELSGGDIVQGRSLFKEPIKFKPQFKIILTCNHLPEVPSGTDIGTWRRIRVAEFTSRFVDNPDPSKSNEFAIDRELSAKFDNWKEVFMGLLVSYYIKYREEGISEPDDVTACTAEYQKSNDIMSEFLDDRVERGDPETFFVGLVEMYEDFKDWLRRCNPTVKVPRRKEIQMYCEKEFGSKGVRNPKAGWRGYRLKAQMIGEDDD
jgi:P4 family phage/plasmid primase-like protien